MLRKVKKEGSCTIPARKLHDYVKLLPDADITIKLLENHWVSIRCGRSNTKMVGMATSNFPSLPVFPTAGVIQIPAQSSARPDRADRICHLQRRIAIHAEWCADAAETGIDHHGRHRWPSPGALERSGEKFEGVSGEMKTLVPKKAMDELKSLLDSTDAETIEFAKDESTLFFRIGSRLLTSRATDRTVPELRSGAAEGQQQDRPAECG